MKITKYYHKNSDVVAFSRVENKNGFWQEKTFNTREMSLDILINGVVFKEINQRFFVVYGEEDKFPFLQSVLYDDDDNFPTAKFGNFPRREYKSIFIDGKFYAPTFNTKEK